MRLIIALALATLLAVIGTLGQKNTKPMMNGRALQSEYQEKNNPAHDSRNGDAITAPDEDSLSRLSWLWQAINKVMIFVLTGWALGRLFMQFRRWIAIFVGIVIVFDFLLVLTGLVELNVRWENMARIFEAIKSAIISIGFVEFLSMLIGMWAGVKGYLAAERRQQTANAK